MKKTIGLMRMAIMFFIALPIASCSDKNETESGIIPDDDLTVTDLVNPGKFFPMGLPMRVTEYTYSNDEPFLSTSIRTNEKGQITSFFEFTRGETVIVRYDKSGIPAVLSADYDMSMECMSKIFYIKLNSQGLATQIYEDWENDFHYEYKREYNASGQVVKELTRYQEHDGVYSKWLETTFVYNKEGALIEESYADPDGIDNSTRIYEYTGDNQKTPIANVAGLDIFVNKLYDVGLLYYVGVLGKGSTQLPLRCTANAVWGGESLQYKYKYVWETGEDGYPIKMTRLQNQIWDENEYSVEDCFEYIW